MARHGITPAWAGNTTLRNSTPTALRNYPRLGGEYIADLRKPSSVAELPPLARGIRSHILQRAFHLGITPACAGNTGRCLSCRRLLGNYPRLRGEYSLVVPPNIAAMELPPLTRGIPIHRVRDVLIHGITPACAGNTHPYTTHPESLRNYPRSRGEYRKSRPVYSGLSELPPLARGIHCLTGNFRLIVGDIVELTSKA